MDVRRGLRDARLVGACALLWACGGDPGSVAVGGGEGGGGSGGGVDSGVSRDAGGDAAAAIGPLVTIKTPLASSDPISGGVLVGSSLEVECEAIPRANRSPVDPTKVTIGVYAATGTTAVAALPATLRSTNVYAASIPLDAVPTGKVRIRCSATDTATASPQTGVTEIETYYDGGPVVTITNLTEKSVIARGSNTNIDLSLQFKVEPAPLADNDPGAAVSEVKLSIGEREVTLDPPVAGTYTKELDFYGYFSGAPIESVTIEVSAKNMRAQGATTVKKKLVVKVDGEGPRVDVTSPALVSGQPPIVGGTVSVQASITDTLAGVAEGEDKLFALIIYGNMTRRYPLTKLETDKYGFTFEASAFSSKADVVAQFHAFDKAGNESVRSHTMRLDTVPPWVSLDAPSVRMYGNTPLACSEQFDPLGYSPKDKEVIAQLARFRVMVWERGIELPGATEIWIAGVRNGSVDFFAQSYGADGNPSNAPPLIIDQDHDGVCDTINNSVALGDRAPFVTAFSPIATGGAVRGSETPFSFDPIPPVGLCLPAPLGTQPLPRCDGSELSYVVPHSAVGRAPVIYGHAPTGSGLGCTGVSFDVSGIGGWTCVAVAARDLTGSQGNLGISPPLRVCRKVADGDCNGQTPGTTLEPPPNLTCTDGCTLPPIWSESAPSRFLPL